VTHSPGQIRDAIIEFLEALGCEASINEILTGVSTNLGYVPSSSIRSYLNLNTGILFERRSRGRYCLKGETTWSPLIDPKSRPDFAFERAKLFRADCFDWLTHCEPNSFHAVVTDPPYGLVEYTETEQSKLRNGKGGVWRIPPSFDGHQRSPLPRFTVLNDKDRRELHGFFLRLAILLRRVCVPGANIVVASNPLLAHIVTTAMAEGGLEVRGHIVRLVMTMRGGDRPKNAHSEFSGVSVMPRSQWEPWIVLRKPLEGRAQDNLRKWKTGGFRRPTEDRPFGDVIKSAPTSTAERKIADHPSLKPQAFLRQIVRGVLPLGEGIILDPFAGSASTLAAANAVGYESIGLEVDPHYVRIAKRSLAPLSRFRIEKVNPILPELEDASTIKRRRSGAEIPTRISTKIRVGDVSQIDF
jgi:DNA modification methylase